MAKILQERRKRGGRDPRAADGARRGLVVFTLLAGCSTTTPDQDLRRVPPLPRVTSVTIQTVQKKVLVPVVLTGSQTVTFRCEKLAECLK